MKKDVSMNKMGIVPVKKLMLGMGVPMILSMMLQALYNIVDSYFVSCIPGTALVSNMGDLAVNALTLAFPIQMLMVAIGVGTGVGVNTLLARSIGQGNKEKANQVAGNAIFLALCTYIVFLIFGIFGVKGYINSQTSDVLIREMATSYLGVCCIISFGSIISMVTEKLLQSTGKTILSTASQIGGALTNLILDPILIFKFNLGVKGAALATLTAQAVSAAWVLKFLFGNKSILKIRKKNLKLDKKIIISIVGLGMAPFIMQSTESLVLISLNTQLAKYGGDLAIGAMTIMSSIMQMVMLPMSGLTQGAQPIISYNYGAKNMDRVKKAFKLCLISCLVYSTTVWLILMISPEMIVRIFNSDPRLLEITSSSIKIYFAGIFMFVIQISCQQTFLSLGQAKISLFLALLRKIILLIPLVFILPIFINNGLFAVLLAEPVADILAALTTATCFAIFYKKTLSSINKEDKVISNF